MFTTKREKVKSTPFSEFVRNANSGEKRKFFDKVVKETIAEASFPFHGLIFNLISSQIVNYT